MGFLRLCLALAVVVAHSEPLFGWDVTRLTGGRLAVQMFYIISGFYITLVLHRRYTGPGHYGHFMRNRFLRLYPAYATVALLTLVIMGALSEWTPGSIWPFEYWSEWGTTLSPSSLVAVVAANLFIFGQDALMFLAVDPGLGGLYFTADFTAETIPAYKFLLVPQAWTLGVELLFYVVAPLLVTRKTGTLVVVFALGLALRAFVIHGLGLHSDPWDYRFFPIELPLFLWGAIAYKAYAHLEAHGLLHREAGTAALILVLGGTLLHTQLPGRLQGGFLGLPFMCFALGLALPFLFHRTRSSARDRWIGDLSYPIYVVHLMIVMLLGTLGWTAQLGLSACAISILLAILLRVYIEAPIDRWRHADLNTDAVASEGVLEEARLACGPFEFSSTKCD